MTDDPNAVDEQLSPYVIEGARSSRSRCKTCRRKIDKGALRFGVLIEGPYGTGYMWHHLKCAARQQFDKVEEAYGLQAWNAAKDPPDKVPDLEKLKQAREDAEDRKRQRKEIPYAELAPSGRAKCKHCDETITKDSARVVLGRGVYFGTQVRTAPINVHPRCVAAELQADDCNTEDEGFTEALRANSADLGADVIDRVLAEIGNLG